MVTGDQLRDATDVREAFTPGGTFRGQPLGPAPVKLVINMPPLHEGKLPGSGGQREIAEHPARFKVVCCGRRWGKTLLGVVLCLLTALPGGRTWWVGPHYKEAKEGWNVLVTLARQIPSLPNQRPVRILKGEQMVVFPSGGSVQVRTAIDPQSLRGAGLDGIVFDEAAFMQELAWTTARPALSDRQGWAVFISTPNYLNWFFDLFNRAETAEGWAAWRRPSWDNPHWPDSERKQAEQDAKTQADFDREYGADFNAVADAIYDEFDPELHVREVPEGTVWLPWYGALGVDYGTGGATGHDSAVAAITVAADGRRWVRACWAAPTGDYHDIARVCHRFAVDYSINRGRTDPNQEPLAQILSGTPKAKEMNRLFKRARTGPGSREARIGMVQTLLRPIYGPTLGAVYHAQGREVMGPHFKPEPGLYFDKSGPGMDRLIREMVAYRWERQASNSNILQPQRSGEDCVAAVEYAQECIENPGNQPFSGGSVAVSAF